MPSPAPDIEHDPYLFSTSDEAVAQAAELGCSGFRGVSTSLGSGYMPCADEAMFEALITSAQLNIYGEPCRLDSNPNARFTAPITDLDQIEVIVPPGSASGGVIKPHSYLHTRFDGPSGRYGDGRPIAVPVYAPADSELRGIGYYTTSLGTDEYLLTFAVTCELTFKFDHVLTVVDRILEIAPNLPLPTSQTVRVEPPLRFAAGDLIGYTPGAGGAGGAWDFGAYSTLRESSFANQERYETEGLLNQSLHAVCSYDLYDEPLRSQFHALFGGPSGTLVSDAECDPSGDVVGTVAGAWFSEGTSAEADRFAIRMLPDGEVRMSGSGLNLNVPRSSGAWADPASVTKRHCYASDGAYVFLELLGGDRIGVASGSGSCPSALPDDHRVYVR